MKVESVNIAQASDTPWGRSACPKRPVQNRLTMGSTGLEGDEHVDSDHTGPYFACTAYAAEDLEWWAGQLGTELAPGAFGENFTLRGIDVREMLIGQFWYLGTIRFEVMGPVLPSAAFAAWTGQEDWVGRFAEAARPGVYLRPIVWKGGGDVASGDSCEIVWTPQDGVTIRESWLACAGDADVLRRILDVPGRSPAWDALAGHLLGASAG
ncbi:MOSC domain-containing protein [Nonomuraea sp. NPDC050556]|uniref:MOSC domain-containing protein n=1 Tax=Nonomuraea sp. NPDC050556 TaxID=3364369 RepID=UPI0037ADC01A